MSETTTPEISDAVAGRAMSDLLDADLRLLHHTLGISDPYQPEREPYRNYFVASDGHSDMPGLNRLVAAGMMKSREHPLCGKGSLVFYATDIGKAVAIKTRPKVSRNKLRYRRFLSLSDCCPDLTFRQFLTDPEFRDYR